MAKFKVGESGNPNGRPRKPEIELFREAIRKVEESKDKTLLVHAVERAFAEDVVLVALLKKILPDKMDLDMKENMADEDKEFIINSIKSLMVKK